MDKAIILPHTFRSTDVTARSAHTTGRFLARRAQAAAPEQVLGSAKHSGSVGGGLDRGHCTLTRAPPHLIVVAERLCLGKPGIAEHRRASRITGVRSNGSPAAKTHTAVLQFYFNRRPYRQRSTGTDCYSGEKYARSGLI